MTSPVAREVQRSLGLPRDTSTIADRLKCLEAQVARLADALEQAPDAQLDPGFYSVATLAKRLAISERTLRDMLDRGEIAWYRIGPQRRIDPADVDRWLAERKQVR